ncbi:helicase C-terminal domain-containing protein [Sulfodiicoccus acidiphilus]|uniref:helicase C-terminal domain-containing protein n=1 Tax=Sulfodiicoccus acidiphilus TaxID=1670455 RepID=UPI000F82B718|nr:helicase C-terminal domain-containing protein [Sulfodiicoccus acidiphilus]
MPTTVQGKREWLLAKDVTTSFQKRSDVMWGKYASYLMRIYHVSRANVLALVPSYEVLRKVLGRLKGINVLPEDSRTSMEDLSRAAENGKVLILAVNRGKLSEGIELTNGGRSLISDVALVGIPFPSPDDYSKLRAEAIAARTGVANEELLVRIPALIAVKQAIGRALRNPGDSVTVWLLDKRYDSPWWKARLGAFNPRKIVL